MNICTAKLGCLSCETSPFSMSHNMFWEHYTFTNPPPTPIPLSIRVTNCLKYIVIFFTCFQITGHIRTHLFINGFFFERTTQSERFKISTSLIKNWISFSSKIELMKELWSAEIIGIPDYNTQSHYRVVKWNFLFFNFALLKQVNN